jgi:hypothetical protein
MEIMAMAIRSRSSECSDKIKKWLNAILGLCLRHCWFFNPKRLSGKCGGPTDRLKKDKKN